MKKALALVICFCLVATLFVALTACYVSKPATMAELVGTYALKSFTRTPKTEGEEKADPINLMEQRGIVAYLVVKDDGFGYYVYKDSDTALSAEQIKIHYTMDGEDETLVKEINYDNGSGRTGYDHQYPGSGRETLGLTFAKKKKTLNFSNLQTKQYSQSVSYEKVSNASDLSFVNKKLGVTLSAIDFGMKKLEGLLLYTGGSYDSQNPFIYLGLELNPVTMKATKYYALKEDEIAHKDENLSVTLTYTETGANLFISGLTFTRTFSSYPPMLSAGLNYTTDDGVGMYLSTYYLGEENQSESVDEILEGILENYILQRQEAEQAAGE